MKTLGFFLISVVFIIGSSFNDSFVNKQIWSEKRDTVRKSLEFAVESNNLTRGLSALDVYDVHNQNLYLINKNKFLVIDLKNGRITTNTKINMLLANRAKANKPAQLLRISNSCYFISFWNELYCVDSNGVAKKIFSNNILISSFQLVGPGLLIADKDSVKLISTSGVRLSDISFLEFYSVSGFINSNGAINYQDLSTNILFAFVPSDNDSRISVQKFSPLSPTKSLKSPFIAFADNKRLAVFDYENRDKIYLIKKGDSILQNAKIIELKPFHFKPSVSEMQKEEGYPNFKILCSDGVFYSIILFRGKLLVLNFGLNLEYGQ